MIAKIERKYIPEKMRECIEISVQNGKNDRRVLKQYPIKKDGSGNETVDCDIVKMLKKLDNDGCKTVLEGL